ncbi:MAG: hypothetical protein GX766_02860 [Firmicutes bacterium]|nr:hypothetical protein [Bacillota bacterium]HOB22610.1 hypothetical protein [Bacillota bacterium]HQD39623.1 hypothetical protein [Bacillota bacterium]
MEEQTTKWERCAELFSFLGSMGRVLGEAVILLAANSLFVRWFSLTTTQGLVVLFVLYFFAQARYVFAEIQVYQNLRDFIDRVGDGPGFWDDEYDDFEDEEFETPRRHLTPVYPFAERRKHDNNTDDQ